MNLHQVTKELQEKNQELRELYSLRTIRRILKLVVVGFFVWKDLDNKILQLTTRKDQIINDILGHCNQASQKIEKRVQEIENSGTYLIHACEDLTETVPDDAKSAKLAIGLVDHNLRRTFFVDYLNYHKESSH